MPIKKSRNYLDLEVASDREKLVFLAREQQMLSKETTEIQQNNRRSTPRADLQQEITLRANGISTRAHTIDLGFGGAQISGKCPVRNGELLTIGLQHNGQWGAALTRVRRVGEDRFSVKFLTQSSEFMCVLVEVVAPHLPLDAWEQCAS